MSGLIRTTFLYFALVVRYVRFLVLDIFFSNSWSISSCERANLIASWIFFGLWILTDFSNKVCKPPRKKKEPFLRSHQIEPIVHQIAQDNLAKNFVVPVWIIPKCDHCNNLYEIDLPHLASILSLWLGYM